jgi:aspartate racemase
MVENRSIIRLVFNTNYCSFSADQVFLQLAPISFDASTLEIWGALLHGARLVVMPPQPPSLQEIGDHIRKHQVTTMWLTAGLFHLFVDQRPEDLRPLRQLLAGGDSLSATHVRKVLQLLPHLTLINGYGPTENTTFTCCHPMRHGDAIANSVSIGRPIANTYVYLLDEALQPVAASEVGELCAGGDGVSRGYLNAPNLTAEKFIPDLFSAVPDGRLYRTGDLAR